MYHEKNMFLRHFRRFERCSYHLIESVTTYSESQCEKTRSGILRDNGHHPSRTSRKQNCSCITLMFSKLFVQLYNN